MRMIDAKTIPQEVPLSKVTEVQFLEIKNKLLRLKLLAAAIPTGAGWYGADNSRNNPLQHTHTHTRVIISIIGPHLGGSMRVA